MTNMDMNKAKDSIKRLFEAKDVKYVIYIDDNFGIEHAQARVLAKAKTLQEHLSKMSLPFDTDEAILDRSIAEWWRFASTEDKINVAKQLRVESQKSEIEYNLGKIFSCEYHCFKPEQKDDAKVLIQNAGNHNCLCLIDRVMGGDPQAGDRIALEFAELSNTFVTILSATIDIQTEVSTWASLQSKDKVFTLSKKRFEDDDIQMMVIGVRNVLWLKQVTAIKTNVKSLIDNSIRKTKDNLDKIDMATFDHIIMDVSVQEGCWEFDTLYRVIKIIVDRAIQETMLNDYFSAFQGETEVLRKIKNIDKGIAKGVDNEMSKILRYNELYVNGDFVNKTFSQVCNGDIFEIRDTRYMLLCQPCNLEIRSDGKRNRDMDQSYLVPIVELEKGADGKESPKEKKPHFQGLEMPQSEKVCFLNLAEFKTVSLSVIDLVAFNPNGIAHIDMGKNVQNVDYDAVLQENMKKRYGRIYKKIKYYYDIWLKVCNLNMPVNEKVELKKLCSQPCELGCVIPHPELNGKVINFGIRRVARLRNPLAQDMLEAFMGYMARPAYDVDFSIR